MTVRRQFLIGSACAFLTACGAGNSSSPGNSTSGPTPSPSPSPSPTPTASPVPVSTPGFGTLGVATDQTYASIGFFFKFQSSEWWWIMVPNSTNLDFPMQLRFSQPDKLYLSLDGTETLLVADGSGGFSPQGQQFEAGYKIGDGRVRLQAPMRHDGMLMKHTGIAFWSIPTGSDNIYSGGNLAYGIATEPNSLPTSGIGRYTNRNADQAPLFVDFGNRLVSGEFKLQPWFDDYPPTTYSLQDVRISDDGTSFAGDLAINGEQKGRVEGRFNGPAGAEMMLRFSFASGGPEPGAYVIAAARE